MKHLSIPKTYLPSISGLPRVFLGYFKNKTIKNADLKQNSNTQFCGIVMFVKKEDQLSIQITV